jgi:hypothetical protein
MAPAGSQGRAQVVDLTDLEDVFDAPDGEPTEVFVNPFSCGVNPMRWRELQVHICFPPPLLNGVPAFPHSS